MSEAEIKELLRQDGLEYIPGGYWGGAMEHDEIVEHLEKVSEKLYKSQGRRKPFIHTLSYQASGDAKAFMEKLTDEFKGKFREVEFDD